MDVDLSFSLLDAQGQTVVGSEEASISYLLQMLILPTGADCTTVQSCDRFKLQLETASSSRKETIFPVKGGSRREANEVLKRGA